MSVVPSSAVRHRRRSTCSASRWRHVCWACRRRRRHKVAGLRHSPARQPSKTAAGLGQQTAAAADTWFGVFFGHLAVWVPWRQRRTGGRQRQRGGLSERRQHAGRGRRRPVSVAADEPRRHELLRRRLRHELVDAGRRRQRFQHVERQRSAAPTRGVPSRRRLLARRVCRRRRHSVPRNFHRG